MRVLCFILLLTGFVAAKPVTLDGRELDVPTTIKDGRTMVELRTLAEQLGWRLEYRNGRAVIFTGQSVVPRYEPSPEPIPSEEVLSPADGSVTYNLRPEIKARFTTLLSTERPFKLVVNGQDKTVEAILQANEIRWRPSRQIGAGLHKIELTAVDKKGETLKRSWSFRIENRLSY